MPDTIERDVLSQDEAAARAARVSNARYELSFDLLEGSETYRADMTLRFSDEGDGDLFLDFRGGTVERLEINGTSVEPVRRNNRMTLPAARLAPETEVRVIYENAFDRDGDGFHRFVDPEDGAEYVYTNFEPFEAHRLFPCFDQPDIKGTYTVSVTAPEAWTVVANSREVATATVEDGRSHRRFESVGPFSTYLVAVIAGPYHGVHASHDGMPLAIYCRRSLARFLDPEEIFEVTRQGLDFFGRLFDRAYPFPKFDQIFVPEFNAGAMENVGAVTIAESDIFRDPPTDNQRLTRAETILHELGHMWFGNLVTMRWWNDLWLNESFATYVAYLALAEATRFRDAWKAFNSSFKRWAYAQDQLVTTHPISGDVPDTDATFLNFDGITYGKGAAVLRQLGTAIGRDGLEAGLRTYFRRHEWGNATLTDFLAALEDGSGRPLRDWARLWLETTSLNTLAAELETDGGRITGLSITQTAPPDHATLRPHVLRIALVSEGDGRLDIQSLAATVDGPSTPVPEAVGLPAPTLVFPNHEDHAYAKVALDPASLAYVMGSLDRVDDALLGQLLWMSLWEMVRDQRLRSTEFLELARRKLALEPDLELVQGVLPRVDFVLARYVPEPDRERESGRTFNAFRDLLAGAAPGDPQLVWARAAIGVAARREDVAWLAALADGSERVPGLTVDQDMRWSICVKAIAYGLDGAEDRLAAERQADPSDRGERESIRAEASRPAPDAKAAVWDRVRGPGYGSLKLTTAAMRGFPWPHQRELLEPYVARYFDEIRGVFARNDFSFASAYARTLYPWYRADDDVLERTHALVAERGDTDVRLSRLLRETADDLARALACRAFAAA